MTLTGPTLTDLLGVLLALLLDALTHAALLVVAVTGWLGFAGMVVFEVCARRAVAVRDGEA